VNNYLGFKIWDLEFRIGNWELGFRIKKNIIFVKDKYSKNKNYKLQTIN